MYNLFRSPPAPSNTIEDLPPDYVAALKLTPLGVATLDWLKLFNGPGYVSGVKIKIVSRRLADGDHGQTRRKGASLTTKISTYNKEAEDRMHGWSRSEMLNIVGVHENGHYVVKDGYVIGDQAFCFLCARHEKVIFMELMARFQFSLLNPDSSTGKAGWLKNYRIYFARARKMQTDVEYRAICAKYAQTDPGSEEEARQAELAREYEKAHEEESTDTSVGEELVRRAFTNALLDMELRSGRYAEGGSPENIGRYKKVLAEIEDDGPNDKLFSQIP
jgi:hypothetical protein